MKTQFRTALLSLVLLVTTNIQAGSDFGSAEEAKAMLQRAVAAMEADPKAVLASFTAGAEEFKDRDLYVVCLENDPYGVLTAHGASEKLVGIPSINIVDKNGTIVIGQIIPFSVEGEIKGATYWWPRPNEEEPSKKTMFHTKVAGQICAVGHYN